MADRKFACIEAMNEEDYELWKKLENEYCFCLKHTKASKKRNYLS